MTNETNKTKQANQDSPTPRIYVACLTSYNHGCLHGRWIDADQDLEDILAEIRDMLDSSPFEDSEEHAIHDFCGFGSVTLSEYENLADVAALAKLITEHGEALASAVWDHAGGDQYEARRILEESYQGCFDSLEEWAEQLLDDSGALSGLDESLRCYFDCEAYGRDCELSGDIFTVDASDGLHVFWSL